MSDVILGEMCRTNFGIRKKYTDDLLQEYKTYIDILEKDMITATYGNDPSKCLIVKTLYLINEDGIGDLKYKSLENALIDFCKLHNVSLDVERLNDSIVITIDMLFKFHITYS